MSIKEFDVKSSEDIKAYVVTNGDYSVAISSKPQAYMVCNMLNRLVRNVNEENRLLNEELKNLQIKFRKFNNQMINGDVE